MSVDNLLSKLDKVRRTGPDRYIACCPAHDDKSPSLTIRETDEGRILVHCFGGCSVHEVVAAVGMDISDLFPPRQHHGKPERRPFPAADVLRALAFEALVVAASSVTMRQGQALSDTEHERLILAASRIGAALSAAAPELRGLRHV